MPSVNTQISISRKFFTLRAFVDISIAIRSQRMFHKSYRGLTSFDFNVLIVFLALVETFFFGSRSFRTFLNVQ
jgi:hypothetical protein